MSVHWYTSPDAAAAAEACAHHIVALLEEALSGQEFATLAVSGGSTPRAAVRKLAASKIHWDRVHLFWVDERCVPPTDPASNYKLANDYLIRPAHIPAAARPPHPGRDGAEGRGARAMPTRSANSSGWTTGRCRISTWCIAAWVRTRTPPACFRATR